MKIKLMLLGAALVVAGCATVSNQVDRLVKFIEGEDRIEMVGSSAEVTALVATSEAFEPDSSITYAASTEALKEIESQAGVTPGLPSDIKQETLIKPKPVVAVHVEPKLDPLQPPASITQPSKVASKPLKPKAPVLKQVAKQNGVVLSGKVQLNGAGNVKQVDDQSIITLTPIGKKLKVAMDNGEKVKQHVIDMKDKAYAPDYLVVNVEDTVVFTNSDKIKHNVFSPSGENAFDLGTYSAGKKRGVTFNKPGVVKVYCNIHPKMATFVSVTEKGLSVVSDAKGVFTFKEVPPGNYTLSAWNIRGKTAVNITVGERAINDFVVNIEAQKNEVEKHENKFGEEYKPRSALFDDEFY